jgi:hypothetical protein
MSLKTDFEELFYGELLEMLLGCLQPRLPGRPLPFIWRLQEPPRLQRYPL